MPNILTALAIRLIQKQVDSLFEKARARLLGPAAVDKRLYFGIRGIDPNYSLPGIFAAASQEEKTKPNADILRKLLSNAENYLDAYRSHAKARVVKAVDSWLQEAAISGVQTDVQTVLGGELADVWKTVTNDVSRMVHTEAQNVKNVGILEGIINSNLTSGIEDPVVYFVIVRDEHVCSECMRLHMQPDGKTPKVWYLSEIGHGYHKKGQDNPKLGGLHPHCRCSLVTLMPGFGFNKQGFVSYIEPGWSEINNQRNGSGSTTQKSEPPLLESLSKNVQSAQPSKQIVWRVQDAQGKGPYDSGAMAELYGKFPSEEKRDARLPATQDDFHPDLYAQHKAGNIHSAFATPEHAANWFGPKRLKALLQNGFELKQLPASRVWQGKSGKQILFEKLPTTQDDFYSDISGARPKLLSPEAKRARALRPPEELIGALTDRIPTEPAKLLSAKPLKIPGTKQKK